MEKKKGGVASLGLEEKKSIEKKKRFGWPLVRRKGGDPRVIKNRKEKEDLKSWFSSVNKGESEGLKKKRVRRVVKGDFQIFFWFERKERKA